MHNDNNNTARVGRMRSLNIHRHKHESIRKVLANTIGLSEEIILDSPIIKLIANSEVVVENHKGISEYTRDSLNIKTTAGLLRVRGSCLLIGEIDQSSITVRGVIRSLEYV